MRQSVQVPGGPGAGAEGATLTEEGLECYDDLLLDELGESDADDAEPDVTMVSDVEPEDNPFYTLEVTVNALRERPL